MSDLDLDIDYELQPLPEARRIAAELRRMAGEMILKAKRLEDSCPLPPRPKKVEFIFSKKNRKRMGL